MWCAQGVGGYAGGWAGCCATIQDAGQQDAHPGFVGFAYIYAGPMVVTSLEYEVSFARGWFESVEDFDKTGVANNNDQEQLPNVQPFTTALKFVGSRGSEESY